MDADAILSAIREASSMGADFSEGPIKADCVWLSRKVSLLSHLGEEIRDFASRGGEAGSDAAAAAASSSSPPTAASCLRGLLLALEAAKRFLMLGRPKSDVQTTVVSKNVAVKFNYVIWQLEKVLGDLPYDYFEISVEVQEQVDLVRTQLRRATEKSGTPKLKIFEEVYRILSSTQVKDPKRGSSSRSGPLKIQNSLNADKLDSDLEEIVILVAEANGKSKNDMEEMTSNSMEMLQKTGEVYLSGAVALETQLTESGRKPVQLKRSDSLMIPEDFRCPISLELMRDPVIVSTGQTYERSFIQRWIDCGNKTCPKTQQKLQNLTLTPNYVLRSLIMQWCEANRIEQPHRSLTGRIRKSDGSFHEVGSDRAAIDALVRNLTSRSLDDRRAAAAEIRSLAKRSTDNRILIGDAGAIPALVSLLSVDDLKAQEHAVTSLLNLSIYDSNKEQIILAGAIVPIIEVLRKGSMEARENAAAAIFSLSLLDENKITIGSTAGAIESLVELLHSGSSRGKKDAATALFNLCIYQGNKVRAVRYGILKPLLQMLRDSASSGMVDEALTILSVLVSHQEGKVAIAKANTIPVLIDLLRTGQPRNKENAAAILLALCKKDSENLACIGRLGAVIPLTELSKNGTDRAKRKATSLLEHLSKLQML